MPPLQDLILPLAAGAGLGLVHFGGLWFVLTLLPWVRRPLLWVTGSFLLRLAVTLTGFFLASAGHWERLAVCLLGFLLVRAAEVRRLQPPVAPPKEASNHGVQPG